MKFCKIIPGALLAVGMCFFSVSAKAGWCIQYINSVYENSFPDLNLMNESIKTESKQSSLKQKELTYTDRLGKRMRMQLRPVPGVKKTHNEIIVQMQGAAEQGQNTIEQTLVGIDGIGNLGNYASAKGDIKEKLVAQQGQVYTTAQYNTLLENQRTAINNYAANAIGMGAVATVSAVGGANESYPKDRAQQIGKAETLAELYELMLGMDRRIYERSLEVAAIEAANAGVEALQLLAGVSAINSGK